MTIQEARDSRATAWAEMKNIMAGAKDRLLTGEEQQRFDSFEKDIQDADAAITADAERRSKYSDMDSSLSVRHQAVPTETSESRAIALTDESRYADAFGNWLRFGSSGIDAEQRQMLQHTAMGAKELRAAGVGTASAGGYLVAAPFRARLIEAQLAFGSVQTEAEVITTDTGAQLPWPTVDDTTNVGAILAENTQVTEQDVLFGTATLDAYMYTSKLVRASLQILQDAGFDVEAWLSNALGVRIARILNQHFTTGTGTAQPQGISVGAAIGKTGVVGQTLTFTYGDLIDLIDAVDASYRNAGNIKWMMKGSTLAAARKLMDTQNRPLWEPSLQNGAPDTLLGYPVVINPDMPAMAANAKSILFGDFRQAYVVRQVTGIQQLRLEERYADFLQVGFLAFQRAGGAVQNVNAVKAYRNSAT